MTPKGVLIQTRMTICHSHRRLLAIRIGAHFLLHLSFNQSLHHLWMSEWTRREKIRDGEANTLAGEGFTLERRSDTASTRSMDYGDERNAVDGTSKSSRDAFNIEDVERSLLHRNRNISRLNFNHQNIDLFVANHALSKGGLEWESTKRDNTY